MPPPMRVVVITTSFPRSPDDPSGHFVRAHALDLARAGHRVHVLAPGGSALEAPRPDGAVTVHPVGAGELFGWPGAVARAREAPWRLAHAGSFAAGVALRLRALGPVDRAIAHWIVPSAWPLGALTRAPLEVHAHGADVRLLLATPASVRRGIVASLLRRGARFVFAASALRDALGGAVGPLGPALRGASRVALPAMDLPDVAAQAAQRRGELAPGERLIVAAGRLIASKRTSLALEAAARLGGRARLVVIGDGPERAALEARSRQLGGLVTFTGALPRRAALAWIAAADVLVHPSAVEGAPTVVREARALGVPVVACASGDVAAWAASDPRLTVAEPDPAALAEAIERALEG